MAKVKYYVGVDPSLVSTGVIILSQDSDTPVFAETIKPNKGKHGLERVLDIQHAVCGNIREVCNGGVDRVVIEGYAFSLPKLAQLVELGTTLRLGFMALGWRYAEASTGQVKKYVGIKGKAKPVKEVAALWGFETKSSDLADAYVMARIARDLSRPVAALTEAQQEVLLATRVGAFLSAAA